MKLHWNEKCNWKYWLGEASVGPNVLCFVLFDSG